VARREPRSGRPHDCGGVPDKVSECVELAYDIICDLLWSPVLGRVRYPIRWQQLGRRVAANRETEAGQNLRWAYHRA
jgi:hypothetical protein